MTRHRFLWHFGVLATPVEVLLVALLFSVASMAPTSAEAQAWTSVPADASCARLAHLDPSATNGPTWGATLLAGHDAAGGWFGVDVCGNGINITAPGGANLSCDRPPASLARTGCAPGRATYDGFGLSFQCVELVARFAAWAFNDRPSDWVGNAPDLWLPGNHPRDFSAIPNGAAQAPVAGDVLVWGTVDAEGQPWPFGPADGHVAVVAAVRGALVTFVEENALAGNKNIPSETTSLRHTGSGWFVGASQHVAAGTRALYGWLHSAKNTGKWTGQRAAHGSPPGAAAVTPTPSSTDATRQLPALSSAVVVAQTGSLADLAWTTVASPLLSVGAPLQAPHVAARSLGAPPESALNVDQTPAVLLNGASGRTVFALGKDGRLYAARSSAGFLGVQWQSLGNPVGRVLTGSPVAAYFSGGVEIAALDTSGQMWWRGGTLGNLGGWMSVGSPPHTTMTAIWLAGAPGSGLPLAVGLGADSRLYSARWADVSGESSGWNGWTAISQLSPTSRLAGALVGVDELSANSGAVAGWTDVPVDLLVVDTFGQPRLVRLTASGAWHVQSLWVAAPLTSLIGAVVIESAAAGSGSATLIHVYAGDAGGLKLGEVTVAARAGTASTHWESLAGSNQGSAPGISQQSTSRAISFGDGQSLLVAPSAHGVDLAGPASALQMAVPSASPDASPEQTLTSVGVVAGAVSFADSLRQSTLDARWVPIGLDGQPVASDGMLALRPATAPGAALLLQKAPAGDATVEASVILPVGVPPSLRAGLVLYLDTANWLTLTYGGTSQVRLCAEAWAIESPCRVVTVPVGSATAQTALLKLTRSGDSFSAYASMDGQRWTSVGAWTPTLPPGALPSIQGGTSAAGEQNRDAGAQSAQPAPRLTAPLAFTCAGLFAAVDGGASTTAAGWPRFANYTVSLTGSP